jgi:hypothetical protein
VQHSDNAPYTYGLSHLPCSAAVFSHETKCSLNKLHVTAVSYRDSRTDSIHLFSPIREIQQKATTGPTAMTNWNSRGSSTNGSSAAVKCVCVFACVYLCVCLCVWVCLCVCRRVAWSVTGLCFMYICIPCSVQTMYKFQEILYLLMHFSIQENTNLRFRKIYVR